MPARSQTTSHANEPSSTISFADVAHQTIIFDKADESSRLILELVDSRWVQRLRRLRQTGNTCLVYMFAEHSRFGHSLGVAYLANRLMKNLAKISAEQVRPFQNAVAAAALLHDLGHVAPGSHLGEKIWSPEGKTAHEEVSMRAVREDPEISRILKRYGAELPELVAKILGGDETLPAWTVAILSGGGWNADRGNWTIVDSAMASVSYGRYNVFALLDAFRLSDAGELVLQESRLDALTHFFVARDSMYRQVYQHRVTQAVDMVAEKLVLRIRDLIDQLRAGKPGEVTTELSKVGIFVDPVMSAALLSRNYGSELELDQIFKMTEGWWSYHVERWCDSKDEIVADLASRLRDRRLLKTIRTDIRVKSGTGSSSIADRAMIERATTTARELGFDPRYYVFEIAGLDRHRGKVEELPQVLLDNGDLVDVPSVEPLIGELMLRPESPRTWVAVPKEVKERLGRIR